MTIPLLTDFEAARAGLLRRTPFDDSSDAAQAVAEIIRHVRERGDAALGEYSLRFDGVELAQFEIPRQRLEAAAESLDPALLAALHLAAERLEKFHQRQARNSWVDFSEEGALGQLVVPLSRVGLYVPGGAAPLPSSLLHAAIPARVAGVGEIIV
ncbi:MAG: histidinol dehydrogenase, partial [Chloroflexaceae bacterium]|nr:histidinol dehydrogenase [Chloroflexaceae bacterium]